MFKGKRSFRARGGFRAGSRPVERLEPRLFLSFGLGTNLITNPGAEAGSGSPTGTNIEPVPGWATAGTFTVVQYGAPSFLAPTDLGPATRGQNYFAGGPNSDVTTATQKIDVSAGAAAIDTGSIQCALGGWLGGRQGQDDSAQLTAQFKNGAGQLVGTEQIGPVLDAGRNSTAGLVYKGARVTMPARTRSIALVLTMTRSSGTYNDGYADGLSLVLQDLKSPAPTVFVSRYSAGDIYRVNPITDGFSKVTGGLTNPEGMTVGTNGVLYVGGDFTGVLRINSTNGTHLSVVGTNVAGPEGPTLDSNGNVYVNTRKDPGVHTGIWKITGGTATTAVRVVPPFSPWGEGMAFLTSGPFNGSLIAADSAGGTAGRIVRSTPPAFGGPTNFITGLHVPVGVAVSPTGDVYVVDVRPNGTDGDGPGDILRFDSSGHFKSVFATGLSRPTMLAFDVAGNLYVAEAGGKGDLVEFLPDGSESVLLYNVGQTFGVAVQNVPTQRPGTLTPSELQSIMGTNGRTLDAGVAATWATSFNARMQQFGINNAARVAAFLAQIGEETGGLVSLREGGNVTEAARIASLLLVYGHNPNIFTGTDSKGPNYYGRGPMMLTGKVNYDSFSKYLFNNHLFTSLITSPGTLLTQPDLVASNTDIGVYSAVWYWSDHNGYGNSGQLADALTQSSFFKISENVNGVNQMTGMPNGEAVRERYYLRALGSMFLGLKAGETLLQVNGANVKSLADLLSMIRVVVTGQVVEITVAAGALTSTRPSVVNR